ncbi:MFS transporter [Paenibacillus sp. 79R4]|nr:MFS transporter [Paenibacillus sp. 79R4]NWL87115.1 MFS transporter [Paenibacillus sp. 79R4]
MRVDASENKYNEAGYVPVSFREKLGYGIGDFTTSLVFTVIGTFLSIFYTDIIGIAPAVIGTMMLLVRVIDGGADIVMGAIVDRTDSKHGKARPWLLWMSVPFGGSLILLFYAPELGPTGAIVYAYATYLLVNLIYTAINIPYGTLNALITQDPYQRSLLNIFRMTLAMAGAALITFVTMPMVNHFGGGKTGWFLTFLIIGALAPFMYLITFKATKERVKPVVAAKKVPLKRALPALFRNKYWLLMVAFCLVVYIGSALTSGLNAYYAKYILENPDLVGPLGLASLLPMLIGIPLTAPLVKRFGKRNTALSASVLGMIGIAIIMIDPYNFNVILIGTVVKALFMAPLVGTMFAMLADTIEYGEWKTGIRSEGLVYSAGSFGTKVGSGLGGAAVGWSLAFGGYDGTLANQSGQAIEVIKMVYLYAPLVISILAILILYVYQLDKKFPAIIQELKEMTQNQ